MGVDHSLEASNTENRLFSLVVLFPAIYQWFSIITSNNNMRVFYFLYCALMLIVYCSGSKLKINRNLFFLLALVIVKWLYDFFTYPDSMSDALELGILFVALHISSDRILRFKYYCFIQKKEKFITCIYLIYMIGIAVTFITGIAYTNRWGTFSIEGPYGLAHIFAYELLVLAVNTYLLWTNTKHKKWLIFLGVFLVLIALTTVRTVLLCILVMVVYLFIVKRGLRKFLYAILGVGTVLIILRFTPLFSFVIEKTLNAANNGSITNYRSEIWMSSLHYFINSNISEKLFGNGIAGLRNWNLSYVNMEIQAHNDFLTVLVAFGLLSLVIYVFEILKSAKGKGAVGFILSLLVLIMFNGMYSYCSFVIGLMAFRLLFETQ